MTAQIIPVRRADFQFVEVIFRISDRSAVTLVVPRESVDKAVIGARFPVVVDGVNFEATIMAMRPVKGDY